jgi:hypothetical protein
MLIVAEVAGRMERIALHKRGMELWSEHGEQLNAPDPWTEADEENKKKRERASMKPESCIRNPYLMMKKEIRTIRLG